MPDNLDLQIRRRRLRLNQWDIAREFKLNRAAYISEFENGKERKEIYPNGMDDAQLRVAYERYLDQIEAQRAVV
jgi:hypothetical protein